jgi:hypothetical protein
MKPLKRTLVCTLAYRERRLCRSSSSLLQSNDRSCIVQRGRQFVSWLNFTLHLFLAQILAQIDANHAQTTASKPTNGGLNG